MFCTRSFPDTNRVFIINYSLMENSHCPTHTPLMVFQLYAWSKGHRTKRSTFNFQISTPISVPFNIKYHRQMRTIKVGIVQNKRPLISQRKSREAVYWIKSTIKLIRKINQTLSIGQSQLNLQSKGSPILPKNKSLKLTMLPQSQLLTIIPHS